MKIYDSVLIEQHNADKNVLNEISNLFSNNKIKIVDNIQKNDYCEHSTLIIDVHGKNILVDNEIVSIDKIFAKYKFVANIFCDKDDNTYEQDYARYIIEQKNKAKKLISKYDCYKYFDEITGSLFIPDEEYCLLTSSTLKEFIFSKNSNSYTYVIPNEHGFLLRGASTYYYLLAHKGKTENVKLKHFQQLVNNYNNYFMNIKEILFQMEQIPADHNILILSILDNVRNYILTMINALVISNQNEDETILYNFSNSKYSFLENEIKDVYIEMINIIKTEKINIQSIVDILNNIIDCDFMSVIENTNSIFYDKMLKSHRECDNFLQNYIVVKEFFDNNLEYPLNFISPLYGGIELPLIASFISNKKANIMYISLYGIYADRHKKLIDYKSKLFKLNKVNLLKNKFRCLLFDDNALTGKTLQYIIDVLKINEVDVDNIILVNYVNIGRIHQILDNKTKIDFSIANKYLTGLLFPTKYSKIKKGSNIKNSYLDEFGLFDLSKEYICYYLYKNGLYSLESRVNNYKIGGVKYE